jgi:uncharacterized membrane-anchored protein
MNLHTWRNRLLAATCLLQLGLLVSMIAGAERTIQSGSTWKFRTAPVDPVDLFRGRYARLNFSSFSVPIVEGEIESGDLVYALLEKNDEGFGQIRAVSTSIPSSPDYLELVAKSVGRKHVQVQLPYDRFYMDEERAPEMDRMLRRRMVPSWAVIRVHEGKGVVVDLHMEEVQESEKFAASSLIAWPEGTQVPVSLVERMRDDLGEWQLAECQRAGDCVLAAVDLDDDVDEEFVLAMTRTQGRGNIYYAARARGQEGARAWLLQQMAHGPGRLPIGTQELIEALDATDARGEAPSRRWLRLGDVLLRPAS